jgi:hypothetical protein
LLLCDTNDCFGPPRTPAGSCLAKSKTSVQHTGSCVTSGHWRGASTFRSTSDSSTLRSTGLSLCLQLANDHRVIWLVRRTSGTGNNNKPRCIMGLAFPFGFCIYFRQKISSARSFRIQRVSMDSVDEICQAEVYFTPYLQGNICMHRFEQHWMVQHVYVFVGSEIDLCEVDHRCWLRVDPLSGVGQRILRRYCKQ